MRECGVSDWLRATRRLGLGLMVMIAVTGCRNAAVPMPLEQLNAGQRRGHAAFQVRCAVCHNDRVDSPKNGPALVGVFKKPSLPSGAAATDERVTATVVHGRNMMPAMGADMDAQDMDDLLAYLRTL
jgi:mono/diheme cytochrome c family protein